MKPRPIAVQPVLPRAVLPDTDWAEACAIPIKRTLPDRKAAALCIAGTMPNCAKRLLWLRNVLVVPFGLKPGDPTIVDRDAEHIDVFAILFEGDDQIVLGLDDRHLDFRILLERLPLGNGARYRPATLVKRHNLFGRLYLFAITSFHKGLVRPELTNAL